MISSLREDDLWMFGQLYAVLVEFADSPTKTITRIGGGRISIPEDQANHLGNYYQLILEKYPDVANLELMKTVAKIDLILSDKSRGGASFDEEFWSNAGFREHPDWATIRDLARAFLLR